MREVREVHTDSGGSAVGVMVGVLLVVVVLAVAAFFFFGNGMRGANTPQPGNQPTNIQVNPPQAPAPPPNVNVNPPSQPAPSKP